MAMEKVEFDTLFETLISKKLADLGFIEKGKTIYFVEGKLTISLIRLGGRMSVPGGISHVLCCRHNFLPNLDEVIPNGFEPEVFAYPLKIRPSEVKKGLFGINIRNKPQNLNYDYEVFEYKNKSKVQVSLYLNRLLEKILLVKNWFIELPACKLADQISKQTESAWVEKLWVEAYGKNAI